MGWKNCELRLIIAICRVAGALAAVTVEDECVVGG